MSSDRENIPSTNRSLQHSQAPPLDSRSQRSLLCRGNPSCRCKKSSEISFFGNVWIMTAWAGLFFYIQDYILLLLCLCVGRFPTEFLYSQGFSCCESLFYLISSISYKTVKIRIQKLCGFRVRVVFLTFFFQNVMNGMKMTTSHPSY